MSPKDPLPILRPYRKTGGETAARRVSETRETERGVMARCPDCAPAGTSFRRGAPCRAIRYRQSRLLSMWSCMGAPDRATRNREGCTQIDGMMQARKLPPLASCRGHGQDGGRDHVASCLPVDERLGVLGGLERRGLVSVGLVARRRAGAPRGCPRPSVPAVPPRGRRAEG